MKDDKEFSLESILKELENNKKPKAKKPVNQEMKKSDKKVDINIQSRVDEWMNADKTVGELENKETKLDDKTSKKIDSFLQDYTDDSERYEEILKKGAKEKEYIEEIEDEEEDEEYLREVEEISKGGGIFSGFLGRILNDADDEEESFDDAKEEYEEIDDYNEPSDKEAVDTDLKIQKRDSFFRFTVSAAVSIVLLIIDILGHGGKLPSFISPLNNNFAFGLTNLLLCTVVMVSGFETFITGLSKLFTFKPVNDSLPSFALIMAFVQSVIIMFSKNAQAGQLVATGGIACLMFSVTLLSKYLYINATYKNFRIVSSNVKKSSVVPLVSDEIPNTITAGERVNAFGMRNVSFLTGFLEKSFEEEPTEKVSKKIVPFVFVAVLLCGIFGFFKRGFTVFDGLAVSSVMAATVLSSLSFVLPYVFETFKARKKGGLVVGYQKNYDFYDITDIVATEESVFYPEDVEVKGVKIFAGTDITDAIENTASMYSALGGPMYDGFLRVLSGKKKLLKPVESFDVSEGKGMSGIIDGNKILIGTISYMRENSVKIPAEYREKDEVTVYYSENYRLGAAFAVDYTVSDLAVKSATQLNKDGIALILFTDDFSITKEYAVKKLGVPELPVFVCGSKSAPKIKNAICAKDKASCTLSSVGGISGIVAAIKAEKNIKNTVRICTILKYLSIIAGILITFFMIYSGSLSGMSSGRMLIYQLLWALVTAIIMAFNF